MNANKREMDAKLIHPKKREPKVKLSDEERHERRKQKQREWNKTHKEVIAKSTNKCIKKGRDALNLIKSLLTEQDQLKNSEYINQLIVKMEQLVNS
jgi:hypothetical protein